MSVLKSPDWFVGVFFLFTFDCAYYGKPYMKFVLLRLAHSQNTLNSYRDIFFYIIIDD